MTTSIQTSAPMGAARYVRKHRYSWPGGYALALLTTDGGVLCPDCVASEFHLISESSRHGLNDGWRPAGVICESDYEDSCSCDHCWKTIWESQQ